MGKPSLCRYIFLNRNAYNTFGTTTVTTIVITLQKL